jgi:hypothetical protein
VNVPRFNMTIIADVVHERGMPGSPDIEGLLTWKRTGSCRVWSGRLENSSI